jgi:iron complex transport system substrate-binding protein
MVDRKLLAATVVAALLGLVGASTPDATTAGQLARPKPLFPVTIKTATGRVTIPRRPRRIVSLSPTLTENLFAVGAGSQVIAVDERSNYPRRAPRTTLSGFQPNAEAIAGYRPDLVFLHPGGGEIVSQLRVLRIRVVQLPAAANLNHAYTEILQVGRATGHPQAAQRVVRSMKSRIAAAVASAKRSGSARLSVYHELTTDYYSVTSRTFIGQIYRLFGLRNIADNAGGTSDYPQLSGEYIVASSPDLIFLADSKCCGQSYATVSARPGWSTVRAVRGRSVVRLDDDIASRWGPRVATLVQTIAATVRRARST